MVRYDIVIHRQLSRERYDWEGGETEMKRIGFIATVLVLLFTIVPSVLASECPDPDSTACTYSFSDGHFSGPAGCARGKIGGGYIGVPEGQCNDHLVMKWNAIWSKGELEAWGDPVGYEGAELQMQWNGKVHGGSDITEHSKVIWIGPLDPDGNLSPLWQEGGKLLKEEKCLIYKTVDCRFEAIFLQGMDGGRHYWDAKVKDN